MKNILLIFIALLFVVSRGKDLENTTNENLLNDLLNHILDANPINNSNDFKLIRLTENNFVALRGRIDEESASSFIADILKIKDNKIYVYLITPGGSITSGNHIIQTLDTLKASGKKIICIADHAYSMGFVIFQSCPKRYIMQHSIIMQHQASLEVGGPIENARNLFKLVEKIEAKSNTLQSNRLNVHPDEFHKMTQHDLWLYSDEIIETKAADEIVNVLCDFNTDLPYVVKKRAFFGDVSIEFSLCPLIHTPRNITLVMDEKKTLEKIRDDYENFKVKRI